MAIAFDNTGVGESGLIGAGGTQSWSHTVNTTGATVYADFVGDRATTLSSVTCGGNAMTFVATCSFTGIVGNAYITRYKLTNAPSGAQTISASSSVAIWAAGQSVSYTGVSTEEAAQTTTGSGTSLSQSAAVTPGGGRWVLQAFGVRWSGGTITLGSFTGGTNRCSAAGGNAAVDMSDATASTTFTATAGASALNWGALATPLIPTQGPGFGATGGWVGPVTIPNPFVGPMSLRQMKRVPYVPARNTGLQAPVAYDQQGTGVVGAVSGTTGSWTDNATQGSYVVVVMSVFLNIATAGGISGVTYNGTPMTRLCDSYFDGVPAFGGLSVWGIANAPGSANTVQFTMAVTGAYVTANSFSYTGVQGVSPFPWPAFNSSTSVTQTITNNVANSMVFQAFGTNQNALTALSGGDIRFNNVTPPPAAAVAALAVQDTASSGAIAFSATPSATSIWAGVGLILSPNAWPTYSATPFSAALTKFATQQNVTMQIIGDSTGVGFGDGLSLDGWVGRLGIILGNYYDYNVSHRGYSGTTYAGAVSLRTSPRGGAAPTLTIYNGAISGTTLVNDLVYISQNNQIVATPDVVFAGSGINEADSAPSWNSEEYVGMWGMELGYLYNYYCPGVPVIVTTENTYGPGTANEGGNVATFQALLSSLAQRLVGTPTPLGAGLVQGINNVSMLDTQQAFLYQFQSWLINADGVHPNQFGYQVQANWMASVLAPRTVTAIGASCPPVQIPNNRVGPVALRRQKRLPYISSLVLSAVGQLTATGTLSGTVQPKAPAVLSATTRLSATVTPLITAALAASARLTVTPKPTVSAALTATTHLTSTARPKANAALAATTRLTVTALQSVPARLTATTRLAATVRPKVNAALSVTARLGGAAVLLPGGNPATVNIATAAATAVTSNVATVNTLNYPATGTTA